MGGASFRLNRPSLLGPTLQYSQARLAAAQLSNVHRQLIGHVPSAARHSSTCKSRTLLLEPVMFTVTRPPALPALYAVPTSAAPPFSVMFSPEGNDRRYSFTTSNWSLIGDDIPQLVHELWNESMIERPRCFSLQESVAWRLKTPTPPLFFFLVLLLFCTHSIHARPMTTEFYKLLFGNVEHLSTCIGVKVTLGTPANLISVGVSMWHQSVGLHSHHAFTQYSLSM